MKRVVLFLAIAVLGTSLHAGGKRQEAEQPQTEPSPAPAGQTQTGTPIGASDQARYIASVNGVGVLREDYDLALVRTQQQYAMQGYALSPGDLSTLRQDLLEQFIAEELLYQEGLGRGIAVDSQTTELQFQQMRGQFQTDEEWEEALANNATDEEELRFQIGRNAVIQQVISSAIQGAGAVSNPEIQKFYDENPAYFQSEEQVTARHILISTDGLESETDIAGARNRAQSIRDELVAGADFATVARERSEGPSGPNGGDLGTFGRGQMVPPFEDAAFALSVGEISEVVQTDFGFHIIQVTERQEAGVIPLADVSQSIQSFLTQQKQSQVLESYVDGLRNAADVKIYEEE